MKKYGFFGGSFNPVTKAHIELANDIVKRYELDKVIFVPVGDFYKKKNLISEQERYNMLQIATDEYEGLEVSNIELNENKNLTTLEAFRKIESAYPDIDKYYIMGVDNLYKMIQSEDFLTLANNYKYIIIEREQIDCNKLIDSNEVLQKNKENMKIMHNKIHNTTSATSARIKIKNQDDAIYDTLQEKVVEYIKENRLYENM